MSCFFIESLISAMECYNFQISSRTWFEKSIKNLVNLMFLPLHFPFQTIIKCMFHNFMPAQFVCAFTRNKMWQSCGTFCRLHSAVVRVYHIFTYGNVVVCTPDSVVCFKLLSIYQNQLKKGWQWLVSADWLCVSN